MPCDRIVAIADDLTGALEIGAKFAAHGLQSIVTTNAVHGNNCDAPVWVIDTETRHAPPIEAATVVRRAAELARQHDTQLVYKKTDSTLRGNIAAELEALQGVFSEQQLLYAPAYPELGRTVKDGMLFVDGMPVHETEFANDRWSPVRDCRVHAALGRVLATVMDGETADDVEKAASLVLANTPPRICAGPASLAGALARKIGYGTASQVVKARRCLVVNGSLHPSSLAQIHAARDEGIFDGVWELLDEHVESEGSQRAASVGNLVRRKLEDGRYDALVVFGGDTAFGIHRALGSTPFESIGEITAGVAVARSADLLWITKAGGFGCPGLLRTIREQLT
ncbi:MAG: hypothetical protein JO217_11040 [Acidobacteriaceae bacterium]|nr:hypothetical protein [Acidobacteriaceae bacterium]